MPRKQELTFEVSVKDMPETLWYLRKRLANILRAAAKQEAPIVAKRLVEIAAEFETGA